MATKEYLIRDGPNFISKEYLISDGPILTEGGVLYRTQIVRSCFLLSTTYFDRSFIVVDSILM